MFHISETDAVANPDLSSLQAESLVALYFFLKVVISFSHAPTLNDMHPDVPFQAAVLLAFI